MISYYRGCDLLMNKFFKVFSRAYLQQFIFFLFHIIIIIDNMLFPYFNFSLVTMLIAPLILIVYILLEIKYNKTTLSRKEYDIYYVVSWIISMFIFQVIIFLLMPILSWYLFAFIFMPFYLIGYLIVLYIIKLIIYKNSSK